MTGLQEMLTRGGCGDAAEMDINVTVVRPKRRSLWSWGNRLFCCGVINIDR